MARFLLQTSLLLVVTFSFATASQVRITLTLDRHDPNPGDRTFGDSSGISLRAALEEANAGTPPDTIILPGPASYPLTLGPLLLTAAHVELIGTDQPVIDGVENLLGSALLEVTGASCVVAGITFARSGGAAVVFSGSYGQIGLGGLPNYFFDNALQNSQRGAIELIWPSRRATVENNWVGISPGGEPHPNAIGIAVRGARDCRIGGLTPALFNHIGGNDSWGVVIGDDAANTELSGNRVGLHPSEFLPGPNDSGGVLILASDSTTVGTPGSPVLVVSGNDGDGVRITGGARHILLRSLYIGTDPNGDHILPNAGNGLTIAGPVQGVRAEGPNLVIGGNARHGISIVGPDAAAVIIAHAHIGLSTNGFIPLPNGGDGIALDGVSGVLLGDLAQSNYLTVSGNDGYGVSLTNGVSSTMIQNTVVGATANGASSMPNRSGVFIGDGCHDNRIGENLTNGNLISGNRGELYPEGAGIILYGAGCQYNRIAGNLIGTDGSGTRSLRNGTAGILLLAGANHNIIGGTTSAERNVISGNGGGEYSSGLGRGIHLSGIGTANNVMSGNYLGLSKNGLVGIANRGAGIGLFAGASDNLIGPGNIIAQNAGPGILISGAQTVRNRISRCTVTLNDSTDIQLLRGANLGISPPEIVSARQESPTILAVDINGLGGNSAELFLLHGGESNALSRLTRIDSVQFSGTSLTPFRFDIAASDGDSLLAISTDPAGNSSAYAATIPVAIPLDAADQDTLPSPFHLSLAAYPNPSAGPLTVQFTLPRSGRPSVILFNLLGQEVRNLSPDGQLDIGRHELLLTPTDASGISLASGVYFLRLQTDRESQVRKIILK